jgi:hypothetical protein
MKKTRKTDHAAFSNKDFLRNYEFIFGKRWIESFATDQSPPDIEIALLDINMRKWTVLPCFKRSKEINL